MKIAILSRNASLYSTRRLREAAEARGIKAIIAGEQYSTVFKDTRALSTP